LNLDYPKSLADYPVYPKSLSALAAARVAECYGRSRVEKARDEG